MKKALVCTLSLIMAIIAIMGIGPDTVYASGGLVIVMTIRYPTQ
jgi:hypothetical protein